MTEEDVKSCKFEYDDINLHSPLKVTATDGSETTWWSPDKLPEEEDEQDDEDDSNDTPEKSKFVMVAIPKAFPFVYEDEPPANGTSRT
jgi:hypothetical protein